MAVRRSRARPDRREPASERVIGDDVRAAWIGRLVVGALVRGLLAAHIGGFVLLALVVAVEAADEPATVLVRTVVARVPELWAGMAAVLGVAGIGVAVARLRRQGVVLGLGSLGVRPGVFLLVGGLTAGGWGIASAQVAGSPADVPGVWERGDGGWIHGGEAWPDVAGGEVRRRPTPRRSVAADATNAAAGGVCGAALGLWAGPLGGLLVVGVLLVVDVVAQGLTVRGVLPDVVVVSGAAVSVLVALGLWLRAPVFPRRW